MLSRVFSGIEVKMLSRVFSGIEMELFIRVLSGIEVEMLIRVFSGIDVGHVRTQLWHCWVLKESRVHRVVPRQIPCR
jgi:hypothetical protein